MKLIGIFLKSNILDVIKTIQFFEYLIEKVFIQMLNKIIVKHSNNFWSYLCWRNII